MQNISFTSLRHLVVAHALVKLSLANFLLGENPIETLLHYGFFISFSLGIYAVLDFNSIFLSSFGKITCIKAYFNSPIKICGNVLGSKVESRI